MGFWIYKISTYYDGIEGEETGITTGESFTEAMNNIEKYFKSNIEEILLLSPITDVDSTCASFDSELLETLKENFIDNNF